MTAEFIYRVNNDNIGPRLLMEVFEERGWKIYDETKNCSDHWNLWWRTTAFPVAHKQYAMRSWQYTNHIPKSESICRKDNLARSIKRLRNIYGDVYDIIPTGYQLPLEYRKLVEECHKREEKEEKQKIWICKPVGQSQGRGITIFKNLKNLSYDSSAIVQEYIDNPLLISGYKFDLRLYVCVPSFNPLTVYLYREGLVRFATDKYTLEDLLNQFSHLTNTTLNRQGPRYCELQDEIGIGCKWTIKQLRQCMKECQVNDWLLWQRVSLLVTLTVLSLCGTIPDTINSFGFYGFDVLIDDQLKPWLLEVNLSPALGYYCPTDAEVKKPLLHDLFDLIGLPNNTSTGTNTGTNNNEEEDEIQEKENLTLPNKSETALPPYIETNEVKRSESMIIMNKAAAPKKWLKTKLRHRLRTGLIQNKILWGNGLDWRKATNEKGDWSKIHPINESLSIERSDSSDVIGDQQIKSVVYNLIRLDKLCGRIFSENENASNKELTEILKSRFKFDTNVWSPNC